METRVSKYKAYREEIQNKSNIRNLINEKNEKIKIYNKKISSISKHILNDSFTPPQDKFIHKIWTFDQITNKNPDLTYLKSIADDIDVNTLNNIVLKINNLEENSKTNKSLIFDENGVFNWKWLNKFDEYLSITNYAATIFDGNTEINIYNIDDSLANIRQGYTTILDNKDTIKYNSVYKKNNNKNVFFVLFITSIFLLLMCGVLLLFDKI